MFRRRAYVRVIHGRADVGRGRSTLPVPVSRTGRAASVVPSGAASIPRFDIQPRYGSSGLRQSLQASLAAVGDVVHQAHQHGDCEDDVSLARVESKAFEIPNVRDFDSTVRKIDSTDLIRGETNRNNDSYARVVRNLESRVACSGCPCSKFPEKTRVSPLKIRHIERSKFPKKRSTGRMCQIPGDSESRKFEIPNENHRFDQDYESLRCKSVD